MSDCAGLDAMAPGAELAAVLGRLWVSTKPMTTSAPRSQRRQPSLSMANVLPTPGAAPR